MSSADKSRSGLFVQCRSIQSCMWYWHWDTQSVYWAYIERMGATMSSEAIRIPSSAMRPVRSSAHVGSPFVFPWPNTYSKNSITVCAAMQIVFSSLPYSNKCANTYFAMQILTALGILKLLTFCNYSYKIYNRIKFS